MPLILCEDRQDGWPFRAPCSRAKPSHDIGKVNSRSIAGSGSRRSSAWAVAAAAAMRYVFRDALNKGDINADSGVTFPAYKGRGGAELY